MVGTNVWPNPTSGKVNVTVSVAGTVRVEIVNAIGQKILERSFEGCETGCEQVFDLLQYENGVYLFRIYSNESCTVKPVLLKQ
jgi:hypothetical protein